MHLRKINLNKRNILISTVLILLLVMINYIFNNNYHWYDETIIKIIDVQEEIVTQDNTKENTYLQTVTGVIMNTSKKGETVTFTNTRTYSGVISEYNLKKGDEIFVRIANDSVNQILEMKRDSDLVLILSIFIFLIILVGQTKGFLCLISIIINILIFISIFYFRSKGLNVFLLFIIGSIISIISSLLLVSGINKKSLSAIISSLLSLLITMLIAFLVIKFKEHEIKYEWMDFIYKLKDYTYIFYSGVLLGGIGAIMDISITMSSSLDELIQKNKDISTNDLRKSGMAISKDVIGTMINVLFFTSTVTAIPYIVIAMENSVSIFCSLEMFLQLDFIYVLVGCIGIVISIPIALNTAIFVLKRRHLE